jgi:glycosyltransferase involved in cell wall biosynthesis
MPGRRGPAAVPCAPVPVPGPTIPDLAADLIARGVRRVHVLAWRDLEDRDAGGSELHADEFMRRWAEAGLEVLQRTSAAPGLPATGTRHGYAVVRRGSRYSVFPWAVLSELTGRMGRSDALVEVWNGVPWFSPVWYRRPHIMILHHVHGPMWDQLLPRPLAWAGRRLETTVAPPFYRRTLTVTPSEATRQELLRLGFHPERVTAVDNGTDPTFSPGGERWPHPTVLAVARLAPVKRLELLLEAVARARATVPDARVRIVGEGPLRADLEAWIERHDAREWATLLGHMSHEDLVAEYRRAWVVGSASLAEGWGLSLTEGAACGTPAVATDISGHRSSVIDGVTGILATEHDLGDAIARVLADHDLRARLADAALTRARTLTWEASATGVLEVLHRAVVARRRA